MTPSVHDSDDEILRRITHRNERLQEIHGPGFVVMRQCPLCGYLEFAESHLAKPNGIRVDLMDRLESCVRCAEIHQRTPEVFKWMCGVVHFLHEQRAIRKEDETK